MLRVVGGMPVGRDGRIRTTYSHNPSTLRLSSSGPNLQNLPRGNDSEVQSWVKGIIVAPPGHLFWARDFSGIEAVLVGYFARSTRYMRLAKIGIHDYVLAHMLVQQGKLTPSDLPDLGWSDADLQTCFKVFKKQFPVERDKAKRSVHLSNYRGTPRRMHLEYPETFRTQKEAASLQGLYFELFSEIPAWHGDVCLTVDGSSKQRARWLPPAGEAGAGYLRNPFGGVHRFWHVLDWKRTGEEWDWRYGDDAKRVIAYLPQSTAAAIIKLSMLALWCHPVALDDALPRWIELGLDKHPLDKVGSSLRLSIHDEILGEGLVADTPDYLTISCTLMECPWKQLPLEPLGLTGFLAINTEAKTGPTWASMEAA